MEALLLFSDDVDLLPIYRLRQVAIKVLHMVRNADRSRTLQNHFSVLIWPSCAKAPVSQLVEETASKSVQCGFESHRGHRIDEQPWLEISSRGFFFETHLAHVPLRGGSVPSIHQAIRVTGTKRGVLDFLNRIFSRLTVLSWLDDSGVFLVAGECKRVNGNRKSKRVAQFKNNE